MGLITFLSCNVKVLILGYIIDLIIGDPYWFPHPVRVIGWFINNMEKLIRKIFKTEHYKKIGGVFLLVSTVFTVFITLSLIMYCLYRLGSLYYFLGQVFFSWTIISVKSLAFESKMVYKALHQSIGKGRERVGCIVGRDTEHLSEEEVIKATVETVAENTTDGVVSPMLYMALGGVYLGIVFKAISTLDSMVGYENKKYRNIGWASAKMDDLLNYIPARITGFLIWISSWLLRQNYKNSLKILIRDHDKHKSPNCAWSESAVAGAIGIQLGGTHEYFGKEVYKPTIGDCVNKVNIRHILITNRIMYVTSVLTLILLGIVTSLLADNISFVRFLFVNI